MRTPYAVPPVQKVVVHGHERAFVKVGEGPALLLLHGMAHDHTTWLPIIGELAQHFTVIAPDLLGHGQSAKPRADYSIAGYANGMRDLLTVLNLDKVTVVGHSFGGGVAMQFAYQFPERTERVVLMAPGGMGPEVTPLIRAVTLPFFHQAMGIATLPGIRHAGLLALHALHRVGGSPARDLGEMAAIYRALRDPAQRRAFRQVVRHCVDLRGQIVTMVDRAYLTQAMPMLIVWGTDDHVIPARHAQTVSRIAPSAVVEILPDCGHFPHKDHPEKVVELIVDFVRGTQPASYHRGRWRQLLGQGALAPVPAEARLGGRPRLAPVAALVSGR